MLKYDVNVIVYSYFGVSFSHQVKFEDIYLKLLKYIHLPIFYVVLLFRNWSFTCIAFKKTITIYHHLYQPDHITRYSEVVSIILYVMGHIYICIQAKGKSRIKYFCWVQPICLPYKGSIYEKRQLIGKLVMYAGKVQTPFGFPWYKIGYLFVIENKISQWLPLKIECRNINVTVLVCRWTSLTCLITWLITCNLTSKQKVKLLVEGD